MKKGLVKKWLILGIITLLVAASVVPIISSSIEKNDSVKDLDVGILNDSSQTNEERTSALSDVDWWSMFRHDSNHTGFSTSDAPDRCLRSWDFTTGDSVVSSPAVADGKVYIGSEDGYVYCLYAENGSLNWGYETGSSIRSSPAVADGKVYIGSDDHKVYCLYAENGSLNWSYQTGDYVYSSPTVADDKVYFGSADGYVYCLYAENGSHVWDYSITPGEILSSPAVADGKVYIGSEDGYVYCLYAENGNISWFAQPASPGDIVGSPAVVDDRVYIGGGNGYVYCLDAENGDTIWDHPIGGELNSSPAVAYGKVYIGSNDKHVYCLDAETGDEIWRYRTGDAVYSSPAVADYKVYIGSADEYMYCLDANEGYSIWTDKTDGQVDSSPAVADGIVYVASSDGKIYTYRGGIFEVNFILPQQGCIFLRNYTLAYFPRFFGSLIIGPTTVTVKALDTWYGIEYVQFSFEGVEEVFLNNDSSPNQDCQYSWDWPAWRPWTRFIIVGTFKASAVNGIGRSIDLIIEIIRIGGIGV